ncbi:MAG TPA: two-component regulator propeller domain-containing protein, partial [Prolixibacteraceae bacterium]|nr:two-component regulator propeller domain-containing protein [Prolixibacteraceae bacterium]
MGINEQKPERNSGYKPFMVLILILYFFGAKAQTPDTHYRFHYLLIEDGLPQNTIVSIARDPYGFMWFGTNSGLCRYDGFVFETFQSDPNRLHQSLPDNMIRSLVPGNDHRLWIGTNKGLAYYDNLTGKMVNYSVFETGCSEIIRVTSIVSSGSQLWVATADRGIFLLKAGTEGRYSISEHFSTENLNLPSNSIQTVYLTPQNVLFAGSTNGLYVFNPINRQFTSRLNQIAYPQNVPILNIFESSSGDFYLATGNGMAVLRKNRNVFQWYVHSPIDSKTLAHNTVNSIREDARGGIAVGSLGGLQLFDPQTGRFSGFPLEGPDHFRLNNKFVNTIFCDLSGNVWIGTDKGGINKYNVFQNQFGFLANDPNNPNSLNENTINSIYSEGNTLWIGTAGGGINRVNRLNGQIQHIHYQPLD